MVKRDNEDSTTTMIDYEQHNTFILIPKEILDELIKAIQDLKQLQDTLRNENSSGVLGDYIAEEDAMKVLARGKTWFWNKRKSGDLPAKKAAGRWYYHKDDITKYIENGRSI